MALAARRSPWSLASCFAASSMKSRKWPGSWNLPAVEFERIDGELR